MWPVRLCDGSFGDDDSSDADGASVTLALRVHIAPLLHCLWPEGIFMPGAQCRVIWMGCYDYVVQMMGFERRGRVKNCIIARIFFTV